MSTHILITDDDGETYEDILLTPGQAAEIAGVTTQTLREWVQKGLCDVASRTPGGQARYTASAVLTAKRTRDQDWPEAWDPYINEESR